MGDARTGGQPGRKYRIRGGTAELVDERRPSGYMPGLRTRGGRQTLVEEELVELPLVNDIRGRVQRWREAGYPGATRTTLDLLRQWRSAERERRLFFCQLEAARRPSGWRRVQRPWCLACRSSSRSATAATA